MLNTDLGKAFEFIVNSLLKVADNMQAGKGQVDAATYGTQHAAMLDAVAKAVSHRCSVASLIGLKQLSSLC